MQFLPTRWDEDPINSATGFEASISSLNAKNLGQSIIPIGFVSQPLEWAATIDAKGVASWFWGSLAAKKIGPGQAATGCVITSRGVPGIRKFAVSAYVDPAVLFPSTGDESKEEFQKIDQQAKAAALASGFKGVTVGPVSPLSLTDSKKMIDFLASLKHQAASLGWISSPGSDGIVTSLDAKLSAAQDSIGRGQNNTAVNQLSAFIKELDAQHGKTINDNAYFLLKANAQFIISKLGP